MEISYHTLKHILKACHTSWSLVIHPEVLAYPEGLSNWMGYDRGDSFQVDFEPNGIPFGSKLKRKLSPRSYPIQFERKWKYSFLSVATCTIVFKIMIAELIFFNLFFHQQLKLFPNCRQFIEKKWPQSAKKNYLSRKTTFLHFLQWNSFRNFFHFYIYIYAYILSPRIYSNSLLKKHYGLWTFVGFRIAQVL